MPNISKPSALDSGSSGSSPPSAPSRHPQGPYVRTMLHPADDVNASESDVGSDDQSLINSKDRLVKDLREAFARAEAEKEQALADAYQRGYKAAKTDTLFELSLIGQGSFGTIYTFALQKTVYKMVIDRDVSSGRKLRDEFDVLVGVYRALGCRAETHLFNSPRVYELYDPNRAPMNVIAEDSPPRTVPSPAHQTPRAPSPGTIWERFDRATIVLDLIPSLDPVIGEQYRSLFFRDSLANAKEPIRMLRLYLGRDFPPTTGAKLSGGLVTDHPLDQSRYAKLSRALSGTINLPQVEDVAYGMGDALGRLHYGAGIDGSDAELVLAGGHYHQARCYVFDFNQCTRWVREDYLACDPTITNLTANQWANDTLPAAARRLATKIHGQERYYPLSTSPLFKFFASGYTDATQDVLQRAAASSDVQDLVTEAAKSFLEQYATLEERKQERLQRQALARAKPKPIDSPVA